jgi:hypothetical protein
MYDISGEGGGSANPRRDPSLIKNMAFECKGNQRVKFTKITDEQADLRAVQVNQLHVFDLRAESASENCNIDLQEISNFGSGNK